VIAETAVTGRRAVPVKDMTRTGHAIADAIVTSVAAICRDAGAVDVLSRWV
jgi:hypothetical protein